MGFYTKQDWSDQIRSAKTLAKSVLGFRNSEGEYCYCAWGHLCVLAANQGVVARREIPIADVGWMLGSEESIMTSLLEQRATHVVCFDVDMIMVPTKVVDGLDVDLKYTFHDTVEVRELLDLMRVPEPDLKSLSLGAVNDHPAATVTPTLLARLVDVGL